MAGVTQTLNIEEETIAYKAYREKVVKEKFQCNYGVNNDYMNDLRDDFLTFSGFDEEKNVRIFEISTLSFYLATLFLPQLSSERGNPHPIITNFIKTCIEKCPTKRCTSSA